MEGADKANHEGDRADRGKTTKEDPAAGIQRGQPRTGDRPGEGDPVLLLGEIMVEENIKENIVDISNEDAGIFEPEAKKQKIDVEDDKPEEALQQPLLTPSRKSRVAKLSKEERDAEKAKRLESKKQKDEEREKLRAEKERLAEEKRLEKEKREREKEEKRKEEERKRDEKRRAEEDKREQKRKEEDEKQKKKEEKAQKKKEEEEKLEAKKREEDERKMAKRKEEEFEEEKKKRASARFLGFFKKVDKESGPSESEQPEKLWYKPFQPKPGHVVAPLLRRTPLPSEFDLITQNHEVTATTYLSSTAVKNRKLAVSRKDQLKAKLFQFHDNYRPPYYGTWRKKDKNVNPRNPCKPSSTTVDYEVDSDAEWEDEPSDAEECKSDEEDPELDEVDSDVEEFMVEPGYLSDGEGQEEGDEPIGKDAEGRAERLAARASEWKRNVLNKSKLVHECQVQLALFRHATQGIGTAQDGASLRREVETAGRACLKACEAARNCVLPQLRHEGVEFTRHASQFIGCVAAYVVEMKRCVALERTFPAPTEPSITPQMIANMESMLETLENLITVHFSTSESSPTDKVTPRRRRATSCRPQCVCSKLKTSYA